jgi:hypothetical protein
VLDLAKEYGKTSENLLKLAVSARETKNPGLHSASTLRV